MQKLITFTKSTIEDLLGGQSRYMGGIASAIMEGAAQKVSARVCIDSIRAVAMMHCTTAVFNAGFKIAVEGGTYKTVCATLADKTVEEAEKKAESRAKAKAEKAAAKQAAHDAAVDAEYLARHATPLEKARMAYDAALVAHNAAQAALDAATVAAVDAENALNAARAAFENEGGTFDAAGLPMVANG